MKTRYILQDGDFIVHHEQDAQDIVDANAASRADPVRQDWGRLVAQIPMPVALGWFYQEVDKDPSFALTGMTGPRWNALVLKKLADPQYADLRCQPGGTPNFMGWRK